MVYGPSHWAVLGVIAVGAVALVFLGRAHRGTRAGRWFACGLAVLLGGWAVAMLVRDATAETWNPGAGLPLHLCDLAWMAAVVALWTRRWWAFGLVYYWGLSLSSTALFTPTLTAPDFPSLEFLSFWILHALVVWTPIYLTWGWGMRPGWRHYRLAVATTVTWAVATFGINTLLGTNYGFLNAKPATASPLDLMGDWPEYLLVESVLVLTVWALITWPWVRADRTPTCARRPAGLPGR